MRITIKTQSVQEGFDIHDKIGLLITEVLVNDSSIRFLLLPNVKVMDLAKLMDTGKQDWAHAPINSLACNLATRIAWLEGLSVASECTGEQYCLVGPTRLKYDPIARPAIIAELIQKHKVDLDWRADGSCAMDMYAFNGGPASLAHENTEDHGGCFATTVLTIILEAKKS